MKEFFNLQRDFKKNTQIIYREVNHKGGKKVKISKVFFMICSIFAILIFVSTTKDAPKHNIVQKTKVYTTVFTPIKKPVSGPLRNEELPWEKNSLFLNAQKNHNTFVRTAAFRTVLPDPLPGEEYNVSLGAQLLCGTVVYPNKVFSLSQTVGPFTKSRGFRIGPTYSNNQLITTIGGGICKIATTLYNVSLLSNLKIIERHPHSMMVKYVPLGQDATVSYGGKDFKFVNNTSAPILIWAQNKNKILYMAFYSRAKGPQVTWNHKLLKKVKMHTIVVNSKNLPQNTENILEGCNGYKVESWLTITWPNQITTVKYLGIDNYQPMNEIVQVGTKP
jgi:hypothetical protein